MTAAFTASSDCSFNGATVSMTAMLAANTGAAIRRPIANSAPAMLRRRNDCIVAPPPSRLFKT